jgi:hypothetical protein
MKNALHIQDSISPVEYHKTELSCIFYITQIVKAYTGDCSLVSQQTVWSQFVSLQSSNIVHYTNSQNAMSQ